MNQECKLAGQIALVTGGARRVGAQIARTLHAAGANVAIHCHRSMEDAQRLAAELDQARHGSACVLRADLRDLSALPTLVAGACERFGGLNLLVNNASTFYPTPLGTLTPAQWQDLIGTNLQAPLFLAQAAAAPLRASRGALINIVDIHGMRPLRDHTVYSVAKAGLIMLTRALARELAPEVRVNGIAPGAVLWPQNGIDEQRRQRILEQTALHRPGSPADIARTVLFFAADAPFVTGQILAVDGGRSIGW
ncbi:MAG: pteridine reductase [Steroidobacteraceae bacterium]